MKKNQQPPKTLIDLLKAQGITLSIERAEQLLESGNPTINQSIPDKTSTQQTGPYQEINGYKVYVQHDLLSEEEMRFKKTILARIVSSAKKEFKK